MRLRKVRTEVSTDARRMLNEEITAGLRSDRDMSYTRGVTSAVSSVVRCAARESFICGAA